MAAVQIDQKQFKQWMEDGNIDEEPPLTGAEGVEVIPTLILYKNGKAVDTVVAPKSKAAIDQFLQQGLNR